MTTTKNFSDLLKSATLPEKTVQICMRGDLLADFEDADRELVKARKRALDSLAGGGDLGAMAERIEALQAEIAENSWTFRLRALPHREFRALIGQHPPRIVKDEESGEERLDTRDMYVGVNTETFYDALIQASLVDPELDDVEFGDLVDKVTDRQYDTLSDAAWSLNRRDVDPFSRAASQISQASAPG